MGRRPRSSGKPKHVKGTATRTNLSALNDVFGTDTEAPNRMDAVIKPHIRRCYEAGLIEVSPDRSTLTLTEAGRAALAARFSGI